MDENPQRIEGVVAVARQDGRFLMIRRAEGILAGGAWCFVGGAIEDGETQRQAVEREFLEEVSGRVRAVRKVWEYLRPDGGLLLHWWLVDLLSDGLVANEAEVAELRWCTQREIEALPNLLDSNLAFLREVSDL